MLGQKTKTKTVELTLLEPTAYETLRAGGRSKWKNTKRMLRRQMKSGQWYTKPYKGEVRVKQQREAAPEKSTGKL